MKSISQPVRFIILIGYIGILLLISKFAVGSFIPPTAEKGLWFYAGLASLLLGYILVNPFYTPPADAFTNGVAAIISLITVNVFSSNNYSIFDRVVWGLIVGYSLLVLLTSALAIVFKDSKSENGVKTGKLFSIVSSKIGNPKWIFSGVYLFALMTFHRNEPREFLSIGIAWAFLMVFQPIENSIDLFSRIRQIIGDKVVPMNKIGEIVGYQFPNILLIKHDDSEKVDFGTPMIVHGDDGKFGIGIALDYIGYAEGRWLRAYKLPSIIRPDAIGVNIPQVSGAYKFDVQNPDETIGKNEIWQKRNNFIGVVAPESDVSKLRIDIAKSNQDIQEGRLIEVLSNDIPVLYQVINGLTKEEIIQQKNTRGYIRADAKKIGIWDIDEGRFQVAKWMPQPNSPVFIVDSAEVDPIKDAIGYFPGTDYPVKVDDIDKLVTHNTAILGILGIGKSYLAFELIERMIEKGIKVICLDITNQYANQLSNFYNARQEKRRLEVLKKIGPKGKRIVTQNVEEGGSIQQFRAGFKKAIGRFLDDRRSDHLVIYNPAEFDVWRQDSKPFQGKASMVSLTPVENAKLITEVTLEILQERGNTENARCCIVFEEAHSLIPEWNSVINDGDKSATNGIARAILQGRKYGLGCLVITQRTANVTKSVLNQCNTVFALRLFDSTGMDFLRNYIGEDYSGVLSTLEDRNAVFFGRASSCKDPVLIRLNDRDKFLKAFRAADTTNTQK